MAVPRKTLLPPYMSHEMWTDLADAIDYVFGQKVDNVIGALAYLRHTYVGKTQFDASPDAVNHPVAEAIENREMIPASAYDTYELSTDRLRLNHVGLRVSDPSILTADSTTRLIRNIGTYWFDKGRDSLVDFISYCLNTDVTAVPLWTKDYVGFVPEGSNAIGTPVWDGGDWYPTTHIRLDVTNSSITEEQVRVLVRLFYDIANYNLVLESTATNQWFQVLPINQNGAPSPDPDHAPASGDVVAAVITSIASFETRVEYIDTP